MKKKRNQHSNPFKYSAGFGIWSHWIAIFNTASVPKIMQLITRRKRMYACMVLVACVNQNWTGKGSGFGFEQSAAFGGIVLAGSGLSEANNECFTVNWFLSLDLEKVSDTAFHCVMVAVFVSRGAVEFQAQNLIQCRLE